MQVSCRSEQTCRTSCFSIGRMLCHGGAPIWTALTVKTGEITGISFSTGKVGPGPIRTLTLWITLGHRLCTSGKWWCARNIQNLMGSRPQVRPLTTRAMCQAGEASPLFRVIDPRSAKWRSGSTSEADSRGTKLFRKRRSASANR